MQCLSTVKAPTHAAARAWGFVQAGCVLILIPTKLRLSMPDRRLVMQSFH